MNYVRIFTIFMLSDDWVYRLVRDSDLRERRYQGLAIMIKKVSNHKSNFTNLSARRKNYC